MVRDRISLRSLPQLLCVIGGLVLVLASAGCALQGNGFLNPVGPTAEAERQLFFEVTALTLIVVVPVLVLTPWIVWRYRRGNKQSAYRPKWEFSWPLEILAWGVPVLIVIALGLLLWNRTLRLDPYRPLSAALPPVEIQVVGLDWKWLFIYPRQGIATLNELVIPVGRPVHLTLTSDTVMQSFMVPNLAGQVYAMAAMKSQLNLQADRAGEFLGENTQYNGKGFQKQKFRTRAVSEQDFSRWLEHVKETGKRLDCDQYAGLMKQTLVPKPVHYARAEAGLFEWVVKKYQTEPSPACQSLTGESARD